MRLFVLAALLVGQSAFADPAQAPGLSKKARMLAEKALRFDVRLAEAPPVGAPAAQPITVLNVHTREVLPVDPTSPPDEAVVDRFLRCHYTNQETQMDPRLLPVALRAAARFHARLIEVVSGYRAPKYNLILRKKGHEVGRDSQHPLGHALDFRLPGLPTRALLRFVKSIHLGGVGFYPDNAFVHADVGRIRYWRGH